MIEELQASQFGDFFRAVNAPPDPGKVIDPFPWQEDLVAQVAEAGRWPDLLDLPTAAGKTAVIDAAVFLHALNPEFPRRIVFVVDRRVVVQQAAERARNLAGKLTSAADPLVRLVAERLRQKAKPDPRDTTETVPLGCAELRGGIVRDDAWALRPDLPTVIVSTVDQVGSRLLFRGYGVKDRMLPVQAGLLANDALFLLDEVHLSRPFAETLRAIASRYRPPDAAVLPNRWQVVELSATPGALDGRRAFRLTDRDRDPKVAPLLAQRIHAVKLARKQQVEGRGKEIGDRARVLAKEAAAIALRLVEDRPGAVVGVLVNRVNTARLVFNHLETATGLVDRCLFTGRMRPLERDDVLRLVEGRIKTGRHRDETGKPLVVIGTQSLEAGADFDFDALVTECASYDALKQRFGRVDRNGHLSEAGHPSESVILVHAEEIKLGDDPVYGKALAKTWNWLPDGRFDFAVLAADLNTLADISAPKPHAPILLPSHLDRWVQTSTVPDADPDVAQWLHGLTEVAPADVNVIWRADLTPELLAAMRDADLADLLSVCRPGSAEAMQVPLNAVRAWLAATGEEDVPVVDLEGAGTGIPDSQGPGGIKPVLRWLGDESSVARLSNDIRPGDTIVVPSSYGGVAAGNWAPGAGDAVADFGHQVQVVQRRQVVLRLSRALFPEGFELPLPGALDADPYAPDDLEVIKTWVAKVNHDGLSAEDIVTDGIIKWLGEKHRQLQVHRTAANTVFTVTSAKCLKPADVRAIVGIADEQEESSAESEPETSCFTGRPVRLSEHLENVADWAEFLARACGLPRLSEDLRLAGRLHDLGKADPRFQDMLRNDRGLGDELLAKSGQADLTRAERRWLRQKTDYPSGGGHELLSLALIQDEPSLMADACDRDLVLHLVASHHGACRPFAPVIEDPRPVPVSVLFDGLTLQHSSATGMARIDSGVADRFWRLVRRYGWFGLAWLECLLRLADHRASEQEQRNG